MLKRLLKSEAVIRTVGGLTAGYIKLVYATSRLVRDPPDQVERIVPNCPLICAMWHGQGLMVPTIRPSDDLKVAVMVSRHLDGDFVHAALARFGMGTVRGAGAGGKRKNKGGFSALRESVAALKDGTTVALTADVPPGPARKAGLGIVTIARHSGRPILPCAVVTSRYWRLNTWSGFTLNLPFSRLVFAAGELIHVPHDAGDSELEAARRAVEDQLNTAMARAYELAGVGEQGWPGGDAPARFGLLLRTYRGFSRLAQAGAPLLLRYRQRQGKEEPERLGERVAKPGAPRPDGTLIWFHAASVGETNAILPLIAALEERRPDLAVLLTTGTVTSARLARERLPARAIHQYVPLDTPRFMERFLRHWQPDLVVLTESEIWPNLIHAVRARAIPIVLVNGRVSQRSYRRWRRWSSVSRPLFTGLDLVLAQNERYAGYFRRLGVREVRAAGNLKMDSPPPAAEKKTLSALAERLGERPVFLAASTHPGEDEMVLEAHQALKRRLPGLLTVIVPRHPHRGAEIAALLNGQGIAFSQRSREEEPAKEHDVYLADTIGELGLFYALAPVAFIGGSLVSHGGQNPVEAIKQDTAVLTGPHVHNFSDTFAALRREKACFEVGSADELAERADELLTGEAARKQVLERARTTIAGMSGALDASLEALDAYLPPRKERRRAS